VSCVANWTEHGGGHSDSIVCRWGTFVRVVDGALSVVSRPSAELRTLIGLRDAAVALMDAESDWDRPDGRRAVEPLRVACRQAY
jgi:hypothetical protein